MKNITRRDFIKYLGAGALGFALRPSTATGFLPSGTRSSDVIQCYHENATSGATINEAVVQVMMDASIKQLTGMNDVGEAWKTVFPGITENSIISIKVNAINEYLPTHSKFVECIISGLSRMQFGTAFYKRNNIVVWDRTDWELTEGGYTIYDGTDPNSVRYFGTNHSGVGYNYSVPFNVDGVTSYPSRILTDMTDYLINAAVLKDHNGAQVTLTMKNHYGSVNNPGSLHNGTSYTCDPDIAALNQQIRDVITPNNIQKIFIIDGLYAKVNWGPNGPPNCVPNKLLMSFDTVACDWQGQVLINELRAAMQAAPVSAPHILTAAAAPYNLGTTDVNLIEINNPTGAAEFARPAVLEGPARVIPNPFHARTAIAFSLKEASRVRIDLIDAAGRVVDHVFEGSMNRGSHRIEYNIRKRLPAGGYFVRINAAGADTMTKVIIMKQEVR